MQLNQSYPSETKSAYPPPPAAQRVSRTPLLPGAAKHRRVAGHDNYNPPRVSHNFTENQ